MAVSGIYVANDGVLGVVAPIGMAAAVGTCLVVDLCEGGPTGGVTLATLVRDGPSSEQLRPKRRGVSFLRNGGISAQDAAEVVGALCGNWPNVVLRVGASDEAVGEVGAVTVRAILSGPFVAEPEVAAVLQPTGLGATPKNHHGHVLSRLSARTVRTVLAGRVNQRSAWVRSWRPVWAGL
jgi:hypothetical protein